MNRASISSMERPEVSGIQKKANVKMKAVDRKRVNNNGLVMMNNIYEAIGIHRKDDIPMNPAQTKVILGPIFA